jgi:hypothetical protein|tara:strand:- start:62 stop:451 length:390 start_codon:yes stop_codon:yes gene_type:complete
MQNIVYAEKEPSTFSRQLARHPMTHPSEPHEKNRLSSDETAIANTAPECPGNRASHAPEPDRFQARTKPSPLPVSIRVREWWNLASAPTGPSWPASATLNVPVAMSHTFKFRSVPPAKQRRPSSLTAKP